MDFDSIECVSSSDIDDEEISTQFHHPFSKAHADACVHELLECPGCTNSMYPLIHQELRRETSRNRGGVFSFLFLVVAGLLSVITGYVLKRTRLSALGWHT